MVSAAVIAMARRARWAALFADHPNERSLHSQAVPRLGGIGVMAASLPMLILYLVGQRYFIRGLAAGGVRG